MNWQNSVGLEMQWQKCKYDPGLLVSSEKKGHTWRFVYGDSQSLRSCLSQSLRNQFCSQQITETKGRKIKQGILLLFDWIKPLL